MLLVYRSVEEFVEIVGTIVGGDDGNLNTANRQSGQQLKQQQITDNNQINAKNFTIVCIAANE